MSAVQTVTRRRTMAAAAAAAGVLLAATACSSSSSGGSSSSAINGAGSTFAAPMYQQWAGQYQKSVSSSTQINYQAIGSGGGISEFSQGVVDFGATDAPMTSTEQATAQAGQGSVVLHIPMVLGPIAVIYNEPGISNLVLDGPTLADIYLGKITKWNDLAIAKLNPGVSLPSDVIQPISRSDSSGTSYVFTSYLSGVSSAFSSQVGISKTPSFPTGTGATGSSGIAAAVQQTKGAIGYVEYGYATQGKISYTSLVNASGQTVAPSSASVEAAASGATYSSDPTKLTFSLVNSTATGAYPLSTPTYIILAQAQKDYAKGKALSAWLTWDLQSARQSTVATLGYAPLPSSLDKLALAAVATVH